jgi:hypothetical protein
MHLTIRPITKASRRLVAQKSASTILVAVGISRPCSRRRICPRSNGSGKSLGCYVGNLPSETPCPALIAGAIDRSSFLTGLCLLAEHIRPCPSFRLKRPFGLHLERFTHDPIKLFAAHPRKKPRASVGSTAGQSARLGLGAGIKRTLTVVRRRIGAPRQPSETTHAIMR